MNNSFLHDIYTHNSSNSMVRCDWLLQEYHSTAINYVNNCDKSQYDMIADSEDAASLNCKTIYVKVHTYGSKSSYFNTHKFEKSIK